MIIASTKRIPLAAIFILTVILLLTACNKLEIHSGTEYLGKWTDTAKHKPIEIVKNGDNFLIKVTIFGEKRNIPATLRDDSLHLEGYAGQTFAYVKKTDTLTDGTTEYHRVQ